MSEIQKFEESKLVLSVNKADIEQLRIQYEMFRELQKQVLEQDVDYGWPSGNKTSKPSLYKSGAEKLTRLFNLLPKFELLKYVEQPDFVYYMFKCTLLTPSGLAIGEGYGSCNSSEKSHWQKNPLANANTILKMAKKRSHVDAILTGLGASNVFTQDLEDAENDEEKQNGNGQKENGRPESQQGQQQSDQRKITDKQLRMIHALINSIAQNTESRVEEVEADIKEHFQIEHFSNLTVAQASQLITALKEQLKAITEAGE